MPEPFSALAADGKTRLYGALYRPANFDPTRRYPLVDAIYAAPQSRRVFQGYVGTVFDRGGAMLMAQHDMVVMTLDARGTPDRSQDVLMYAYGKLSNPGLDDHVAVIRQLAAARPYIDLARVGIYGVSGSDYATARAMFSYPDVFKAGVSISGNYDPRRYLRSGAKLTTGPTTARTTSLRRMQRSRPG